MALEQSAFASLGSALGQSVTLRRTTRGTYDPQTDAWTGDSTGDTAITAIVQNRVRRYEDGRLVTTEGLSAFIPASGLGVVPVEGDLLVDGSDEFRVLRVHARKSAGTVIGYSCELEG
jgi:ribosomal protein S1